METGLYVDFRSKYKSAGSRNGAIRFILKISFKICFCSDEYFRLAIVYNINSYFPESHDLVKQKKNKKRHKINDCQIPISQLSDMPTIRICCLCGRTSAILFFIANVSVYMNICKCVATMLDCLHMRCANHRIDSTTCIGHCTLVSANVCVNHINCSHSGTTHIDPFRK